MKAVTEFASFTLAAANKAKAALVAEGKAAEEIQAAIGTTFGSGDGVATFNVPESISGDFRLIVKAGSELPAHAVTGEITLHCLEGHVALQIDEQTVELSAGQWIYLEGGRRHAVKGIEDSSLLLTILFAR